MDGCSGMERKERDRFRELYRANAWENGGTVGISRSVYTYKYAMSVGVFLYRNRDMALNIATLLRRRIAIQMLDDIILRWITFCTEPCFYSNHIHAVFVCSMQLRSTWNLIAKVYLSWNATQAHSPLQLFSMCVAVVVVIIIAVVVVAVLVVGTTYLW